VERLKASLLAVCVLAAPAIARAQSVTIQGTVLDDSGGALPGAMVVLASTTSGATREATTGPTGTFMFTNVAPGAATIHVELAGFLPADVRVTVGDAREPLTIRLKIGFDEEVSVSAEASNGVLAPTKNADAFELDPETIRRLPIDAQDLKAIVDNFTAASPTGGVSIVVDGVETDGAAVPASAIHRLVINRNPYSVEFKSPGKARVEVETERGSRRFYHGSGAVFFHDSALQATNAFAVSKPDLTRALNEGTLGGPLLANAWSFFVSGQHLIDDDSAIVNARTPAGPVSQNVATPQRRSTVLGRVDYRPNKTDAVTLRYDLFDDTERNRGVGGFRLAEQAYRTIERRHRVQINDHRVVGGALNDFRVEGARTRRDDGAPAQSPAVIVAGAFVGGPSQEASSSRSTTFQAQDTLALTIAAHPVRIGGRVKPRWGDATDASNFGGSYRFQSLADVSLGRPFLFSRRSGPSEVAFSDAEADVFAETNFRPTGSVGVTAGVRYDIERQVADRNNIAPRITAAFAPGGRTVIRTGVGVFYQSLPQEALARSLLFGATGLRETAMTNPSYPVPPSAGVMAGTPTALWTLADALQLPRTVQASAGVERPIGRRSAVTAEYLLLRTAHAFRSRDVNAPRTGSLQRPDPSRLNVFEIQSTGESRTDALTVTFRGRFAAFRGTAQYTLSKSIDDASGVFDLPADSVTLTGERGRADFDRRHKVNVAGTYGWKRDRLRLGAVLAAYSGAAFNITSGSDTNRDLVVNDRPAGVGRNTGDGPAFAQLDLRFTTVFRAPRPPSEDPQSAKREQTDNLELTIDLFNAFDRVNPTTYVGVITSPLFGRANLARMPRTAQVSLRYRF
jgi:carboxypeptidase family protein